MKEIFKNNKEIFDIYVNTLDRLDSLNFRNKAYYEILHLWLKNRNNGKQISTYLLEKNINNIAIYGAGNLGELLYGELKKDNNISLKYIIDKNNANSNFEDLPIVKLEQINDMEKVDCILVTPIYAFEEIKKDLDRYGIENMLCIDEVVYKLYEK